MQRRAVLKMAGCASAIPLWHTSQAQDNLPVRLVSGFAAGGTTDTLCRILADPLAQELGSPVIVETKAGAGGRLAAEYVKNARPDGKTFLVGPDGWAVFPSAMFTAAELRYDVLTDLKAVAQIVSYPLALVVNSKVPATNLAEYAAWLKSNPDQANFGTPAPNGQVQYVGWLVGQALGTPLQPIAYKGNAPMLLDLQGGNLSAAILVAGDAVKQPRDKVRILGVLTDQRWGLTPNVPTFKEQGVTVNMDEAWQAIWAPAGTPRLLVARMEQALQTVLARTDIQQAILSKAAVTPRFAGGEQVAKRLQIAITHWRDIIKRSGYQPGTS